MIHYFLKTFNKSTITKEARNRFPRKRNLSTSDVLCDLSCDRYQVEPTCFQFSKLHCEANTDEHKWSIWLIDFLLSVLFTGYHGIVYYTLQLIFQCKNWQFTVRLYLWQSGKSCKLALKFLINETQWSFLFGTNCFLIVYLSVEVFILVKYIYAYPLFNI